jgi:hypothetical protein
MMGRKKTRPRRFLMGRYPSTRPSPHVGDGTPEPAWEDFGLSAFSMFFMQSESFLSYQRALENGQKRSNCQTLFEIGKIPSDNYILSMLDGAGPALLQPCFDRLARLPGKPAMRKSFQRLGNRTGPGSPPPYRNHYGNCSVPLLTTQRRNADHKLCIYEFLQIHSTIHLRHALVVYRDYCTHKNYPKLSKPYL